MSVSDSSFVQSTKSGIYVLYGYHENEEFNFEIDKCLFSHNKAGIATYRQRYNHNYKKISVLVKNTHFFQDEEMVRIYLHSNNPYGDDRFSFYNNTITGCKRGILFDNSKQDHVIQWNITENTFQDGGDGSVFNLRGHGNITGNLITNWTYVGHSLINIIHYQINCGIYLRNNQIIGNNLVNILLSLESKCKHIFIDNNVITNNIIRNSVIWLLLWKDDYFEAEGIFENNSIIGNKKEDSCIVSSAVTIDGYRKIKSSENILHNPDLSFEITISQPSMNESSMINICGNYLGSDDPQTLAGRIYDGNDKKSRPIVNIVPYYTSADKTTTKSEPPVHSFVKNDKIGGRLAMSTILTSNKLYQVTSDVIIPSGITLTLKPGTHLKLLPAVTIHIMGKLDIMGKMDNPAVITTLPAIIDSAGCVGNIRLVGGSHATEGRLEIYDNGIWKTVCYENWNWADAHVACRQLGFGSGKYFL